MKKTRKMAAFLLALLLAAGTPAGVMGPADAYGAQDAETIDIESAEDLVKLSKECVFDTYSQGKVFELRADIDLTGKKFSSIASFGGTFHGNGHVISGLYWKPSGTNIGLFGRVEPAGAVENLTVSAVLQPDGSRLNVGGIVGINRGRITGCTFDGKIAASENAGGIAGYNEAGGLIENCTNLAEISGLNATGGIAGFNEGIIETCQNRGEVNTKEQKNSDSSDSQAALPGKILDAEKVYFTGGISGRSTGIIKECSNAASVGYLHSGYNTGGIVGMQNGCVYQCTNTGKILGRKDTGGIVGQFEPYVRISYEEDTLQKLQNQIDVLLDQMDGLGTAVENAGDDTRDNVDALRAELKGIRSGLQADKQYYSENTRKFSDDLSTSLDDLNDSIEDFELKFSGWNMGNVSKELEEANKRMKALRTQLQEALASDPRSVGDILDQMTEELGNISRLTGKIPNAAKNDVSDTTGAISDQVENIRTSILDTRNVIEINRDQLFDDLDAAGDDADARLDAVSARMDALFDRLGDAGTEVREQTDAIKKQMDSISDTVQGSIDDRNSSRDEEFIDDISDSQPEELGSGMILECINEGHVESDNNVGGIAGIIGLELSLDPENDIDIEGEYSMKIARTARASVQGCTNRMDVVSTNDYVGGIVGRADAGALNNNYSYGDVEAVNGNYAGGIAGSSTNAARNNYVLCQLKGHDYVGGIVGKGEDVTDNYVMASIHEEDGGEYRGAVAGFAEGDIAGNVMVWEGLPAVDGVTYQSQAAAVSYEEFVGMEHMPEEFQMFHVQFIVDGRMVKETTVSYGKPVPEEEIPEIPGKQGFYACWEENGQSEVIRNIRVNAVYSLWTTTIAGSTQGKADGIELPDVLAEGEFYPKTEIMMEEAVIPEGIKVPGYKVIGAYRYQITSPYEEQWTLSGLRILAPKSEHPLETAVLDNGSQNNVSLLKAVLDGSYLFFAASEPQGTILILEKNGNWYLGAAAALVLMILAAALVWNRKKRAAKHKHRR